MRVRIVIRLPAWVLRPAAPDRILFGEGALRTSFHWRGLTVSFAGHVLALGILAPASVRVDWPVGGREIHLRSVGVDLRAQLYYSPGAAALGRHAADSGALADTQHTTSLPVPATASRRWSFSRRPTGEPVLPALAAPPPLAASPILPDARLVPGYDPPPLLPSFEEQRTAKWPLSADLAVRVPKDLDLPDFDSDVSGFRLLRGSDTQETGPRAVPRVFDPFAAGLSNARALFRQQELLPPPLPAAEFLGPPDQPPSLLSALLEPILPPVEQRWEDLNRFTSRALEFLARVFEIDPASVFRLADSDPLRMEHPRDGVFDLVITQPPADGPSSEWSGMSPFLPSHTVYLSVGGPREWTLAYCVPGEENLHVTGSVVRLSNSPRVAAPYPIQTLAPPMTLVHKKTPITVTGEIDTQGRLRNLAVWDDVDRILRELVLRHLEQWLFRPATREGLPVGVQFVLSIPPVA